MGENYIDTLAMCNISEGQNCVNDANTTSDERVDVHGETLVYLLLRLLGYIGIIYAIFIVGFKRGRRWHLSEAIDWLNANVFHRTGFTLSVRNGRPFLRLMVAAGAGGAIRPIAQGLGPAPVKIKKKKKFLPPMWNPPSRTPHIPRN